MGKIDAKVFGALALLSLAGCGQAERNMAMLTGRPGRFCYNGVLYLQFPSGAALAVTPEGKPVVCDE